MWKRNNEKSTGHGNRLTQRREKEKDCWLPWDCLSCVNHTDKRQHGHLIRIGGCLHCMLLPSKTKLLNLGLQGCEKKKKKKRIVVLEAAKSTHRGTIDWEQEALFEIVSPIRPHYPHLPLNLSLSVLCYPSCYPRQYGPIQQDQDAVTSWTPPP